MKTSQSLHEKALDCAKRYLACERELLSLLIEMEDSRAFRELGFTGIFSYCLHALKFSESQASYFSQVARKSKEVPALKAAIDNGVLSLSKARRIVPVITKTNETVWIERARNLSQRELEHEVMLVNPRSVQERMKAIDFDRHEIRVGLSSHVRTKLERAISLVSRKQGRVASMEETLEVLLDQYLSLQDPVKRAERAFLRRVPAVKHAVNLRDRGKCQVPDCRNETWTHLHHKTPKAQGGPDTVENLITLCQAHHKIAHHKPHVPRGTDVLLHADLSRR